MTIWQSSYVFRRRGSRGGRGSEGRTAGIVIGVIIVCAIIGIVVYCVCVKRRRQKAGGQVITVDQTKGNVFTYIWAV